MSKSGTTRFPPDLFRFDSDFFDLPDFFRENVGGGVLVVGACETRSPEIETHKIQRCS